MQEELFRKLLKRLRNGTITKEENLQLDDFVMQISKGESPSASIKDYDPYDPAILTNLKTQEKELRPPKIKKLTPRKTLSIAAAVAALMLVGGSAYWMILKLHSAGQPQTYAQDIAPGSSKAILMLSSGKKITLDDLQKGDIVQSGDIIIQKTQEGKIVYTKSNEKHPAVATEEINTITTPKGGQFEIILDDGSQVWLNAGSTLTFPVTFKGRKEREVKLTGEAYFEVSKNPLQPFLVQSANQLVTVTGTHFDVSCYLNEPLRTTLAEGSVIVSQPKTGKKQKLSPGEQSIVTIADGIQVNKVDPANYTAWKDDYFVFVQTPMEEVFAQISRWYNVDIDFSHVHTENFDGRISRKIPLSQVLHSLELSTELKFNTTGRRIMVTQ